MGVLVVVVVVVVVVVRLKYFILVSCSYLQKWKVLGLCLL